MDYQAILAKMTLEQKVAFCSGKNFWETKNFQELGIPSISLNDGPHGLRRQNKATDHLGINDSIKATCFPTACATACSWDEELLSKIGEAIAEECFQEGTHVLLGPGANMKRNPLCGRNFEYFSEDPLLSGKLAAAWIRGVERKGIAASLKHFAANNTENQRMSSDSIIDGRALREIYLKSFEIAVREGKPSTVMCAYNKINGTYCSDNRMLLNDILRNEWGFEGVVVTDWGAMNDRIEAFKAGLDLEMPGSNDFFSQSVMEAVKRGDLSERDIDRCAGRMLELILKTSSQKVTNYHYDAAAHQALARRAAAESAVLLKNEGHLLPLNRNVSIALIGALAKEPRYQGAGSSRINPSRLDSIIDGFDEYQLNYSYFDGYSLTDGAGLQWIEKAVRGAKNCNMAIIVAGLPEDYESEGFDRESPDMPVSHNRLIQEVAKVNPHVVVVLTGGSPVSMPWIDDVKAVLNMYLPGQAGGLAVADLITGEANPCGKLAETYPVRYTDVPSSEIFGNGLKQQRYEESIFVGYRYYDTANVKPLFPFGYGLSYTTFEYKDLKLSNPEFNLMDRLTVSALVKNTGNVDGAEIVQVYVKSHSSSVFHPAKELKAFHKVYLKAGEEKQVEFSLSGKDFSYYDEDRRNWVCASGIYDILIAAASNDVRLEQQVKITGDITKPPKQTVSDWYFNPKGKPSQKDFESLLGRKLILPQRPKKGEYTLDCSLLDMRDAFVIKIMIKMTERNIAKGFGEVNYKNIHFKMLMETSCNTPLKNMLLLSPDSMPLHVAAGLVQMANGQYLKGIRSLFKKKR